MAEQRPAVDEALAQRLHQALLEHLRGDGLLEDERIAAAFAAVPRHHFLPGHPLEVVYADHAVAVKREGDEWLSSSSQPAMMAIMLAQLEPRPGDKVLEIGAGTGYNAAILDQMVGPTGGVLTLELDADLAAVARANLAAAGVEAVEVRQADGALGAPDVAPFDRIIVTAGAWDLLPAWRAQLAPAGRIVVPINVLPGMMLSLAIERRGGGWAVVSGRPCSFVALRGAQAHPGRRRSQPGITISPHDQPAPRSHARATVTKEWCTFELTWGQE
jgi:protein-L-isoaspartate(D-aspartate) O-methyltransferase